MSQRACSVAELRASKEIHFIKTHEPPCDDSPALLLVRDGRDAIVSLAHFIEALRCGDFHLRAPPCR